MNERDKLPQLLREYREDLRLASPPPELEQRFKAALREQRPAKARWFAFPQALAAAAAVLVVGSVGWWSLRRNEPAPSQTPTRVFMAEAKRAPAEPAPPPPTPDRISSSRMIRSKAPQPRVSNEGVPEAKKKVMVEPAAPAAPPSAAVDAVQNAVKEERVRQVAERAETVAPPAMSPPPPPAPVLTYKIRREVRTPGQPATDSLVVTRSRPGQPVVLGLSAAKSNGFAATVETLGERQILGYRCTGTRRREGALIVERWHAPDLKLDLLVKTTDAQGVETIEEVTELGLLP